MEGKIGIGVNHGQTCVIGVTMSMDMMTDSMSGGNKQPEMERNLKDSTTYTATLTGKKNSHQTHSKI